jgi:hypothetical protein
VLGIILGPPRAGGFDCSGMFDPDAVGPRTGVSIRVRESTRTSAGITVN